MENISFKDVEVSVSSMASYCSIEEAYRIPAFDSAAKRKKGCNAQGNAPARPNDPYYPENGRGEAARFQQQRHPETVEHFANIPPPPESQDRVSYRAKVSDYDYYCKAYGLCPTPKVEGFENAPGPLKPQDPRSCGNAPQRYEVPVSPEAKAAFDKTMTAYVNQKREVDATPAYVAPRREVDMSKVSGYYDDDLEQYLQTNAMKASADTPFERSQQYFEKVPAAVHMTSASVKPLTENDVNGTQDAKPLPRPSLTPSKTGHIYADVAIPNTPSQQTIGVLGGSPRVNPWQNMWDMLVFVLAGILVIILCEQLFKVAMMVGMRKTVSILEPFMERMSRLQ